MNQLTMKLGSECHCWRVVGEFHRCLEHGGESAWAPGAYKVSKPLNLPPEPVDINGPWFDFLDRGQKVIEEVIP